MKLFFAEFEVERRNFQKSYESARSILQTTLSPIDYNHVCSVIETKAMKVKKHNSSKLEKKFNNLKRKFRIPKVSNLNNDDIMLFLVQLNPEFSS